MWLLIIGVLALVAFGVWLGVRFWKWRKGRLLQKSRVQGAEGERLAERWLLQNGFTDLDQQNSQTFHYWVDGEAQSFKVRPDFFARRHGETWLIEVKTGKSAAATYSATRRQIREYAQLWPHLRYGLFDGDQGTLQEVSFHLEGAQDVSTSPLESTSALPSSSGGGAWRALLISFSIGLVSGALLLWWVSSRF
jgi:Holliday junction resolvase-like predicted endonuclease